MTRITALELRQNLRQVLERVHAGEEIVVTYRGGASVRLIPQGTERPEPAGLGALLALVPKDDFEEHPDAFGDRDAQHLEKKYGKYTMVRSASM